jgi:hypothetical protein
MEMGVDEPRNRNTAACIYLSLAGIVAVGTDDPVPADGDIARCQRASDQVEQSRILDNEIGRFPAMSLGNHPGEIFSPQGASPRFSCG